MRHRQRHAARQAARRQRLVGDTAKAAAVLRHDHVVERAELRQRGPAPQARMAGAPGQHIALAEQRAPVQGGRRALGGVEGEVDLTLLRLTRHLGRHQFQHSEPRPGRLHAQARQHRQHQGGLHVVGGGQAPGVAGLGRIEGAVRRHRALQRGQRLAQRLAQDSARAVGRMPRARQQQRVVEELAQLARCTLTEGCESAAAAPRASRCARTATRPASPAGSDRAA